jgi:hypothetical protein
MYVLCLVYGSNILTTEEILKSKTFEGFTLRVACEMAINWQE